MGLFTKRAHQEDAPSSDTLDPEQDVLRLQHELQEINVSLKESKDQLQSVRDEYTMTVSDVMKIKKELNDKRETNRKLQAQNRNIEMQIEQGRKILQSSHKDIELAKQTATTLSKLKADTESEKMTQAKIQHEIRSAHDELNALKADMSRRHEQSRSLNQELARLTAELDTSRERIPQSKVTDVLKQLAVYKSRLVESDAESQKLRTDLESSVAMIQELRKRLQSAEAQKPAQNTTSNSKIMEAASSIVSSYRYRLAAARKEIDTAQQTADTLRSELKRIKKENASLRKSLRNHDV